MLRQKNKLFVGYRLIPVLTGNAPAADQSHPRRTVDPRAYGECQNRTQYALLGFG